MSTSPAYVQRLLWVTVESIVILLIKLGSGSESAPVNKMGSSFNLSWIAVFLLLYQIISSAIVSHSDNSRYMSFPTSTAFSIFSNILKHHKCTLFLLQYSESPPNSTTVEETSRLDTNSDLSFKLHQDIVIHNLYGITRPLRAGPSRFVHCSIAWIILDSENHLPSAARRLQQGRRTARYSKIPRFEADYFVFHLSSGVPPNSPPPSLTVKVKYGLIIRCMAGATTVNRMGSYYPIKSTTDPEKAHHFPDLTRNFHGARMRITLPTFAVRAAVTQK